MPGKQFGRSPPAFASSPSMRAITFTTGWSRLLPADAHAHLGRAMDMAAVRRSKRTWGGVQKLAVLLYILGGMFVKVGRGLCTVRKVTVEAQSP